MVLFQYTEKLNKSDPITGTNDGRSDGQDSTPDLFEFFTVSSEMCAADDVIVGGKLLPFGPPPPPQPKRRETHFPNSPGSDHRRSSSLGDLRPQTKKFSKSDRLRSSSLGDPPRGFRGGKVTGDYRKLKRVSDSDPIAAQPQTKPRPKWYVLLFGSARVPVAMEMKEIRTRQHRRSPPPLGRREAAKDSSEWGPWKLLQSLSCKGMEPVVFA